MFLVEDGDVGEGGGAGDRVAAEGREMVARLHGVGRCSRAVKAPSGKPLAMPLAIVRMSGAASGECSTPNILPVRPKPVCTSSTIKSDAVLVEDPGGDRQVLRRRRDDARLRRAPVRRRTPPRRREVCLPRGVAQGSAHARSQEGYFRFSGQR